MADKTIDAAKIILIDRWPGTAAPAIKIPEDGFLGTSHHNVTVAAYPLGTKLQVYCPGVAQHTGTTTTITDAPGFATFIYMKQTAQDASNTLAVKHIVALDNNAVPYEVTNEAATDIGAGFGPIAVALSAMTTASYGWYWCGGVCPVDYVEGLDGTYKGCTGLVIGPMSWADAGTAHVTYGEFAFDVPAADTQMHIGYALANGA